MKKKVLIVLIPIFIFVVVSFLIIFMNSKINTSFTVKKVFYNSHNFFAYDVEDENEFIEKMITSYNVSEKQAQEIFENNSDYVKITVDYTIENNSFLPIYIVRPLFCNTSNTFLNIEKPESQAICYIPPKESSVFGSDIIISKNDLNNVFLKNIKVTVLSIGTKVLCDIPFGGYENISDIEECNEEDILCSEVFAEEIYYYQPIKIKNEKYNLNLYNDVSLNYSRVVSGGTYSVSRFVYNRNNYCGIAFFDANGVFESGMAIHMIFDDKRDFKFSVGKSTLEDVKKVDGGCLVFENGNQLKSYHYFSDGTCLEVCYTNDGVISSINEKLVDDLFERLLDDDLSYILNQSGNGVKR